MSHFTVLVAAKDREELEARLLPYHEYDGEDWMAPYLEFSVQHKAANFEKDAREIVTQNYVQDTPHLKETYEAYLEAQKYISIFGDWDGGELHEGDWGSWRNSNAKWDWWTVGGRWTGAIFGKATATPNSVAVGRHSDKDTVLVGETNFAAIRMHQSSHAEKEWDNWLEHAGPHLDGRAPESLSDEDVTRIAKAINDSHQGAGAHDEKGIWDAKWFEPNGLTRGQYVQAAYNRALTFALIDAEGNWVERGNMGWWACVSNEDDSYDAKFWAIIGSLPNDQRLWVVDCHI